MVDLKQGQIFLTSDPHGLGPPIRFFERLWSKDGKAEYNHAGIVTSSKGDTFEALWTYRFNHIDAYKGEKVLIAEFAPDSGVNQMAACFAVLDTVHEYKGGIYPILKLPLFMLKPIVEYCYGPGFGPVCSELDAEYLIRAGYKGIDGWRGVNPDDLADLIHNDPNGFKIVYEGIWQ